MADTRDELAGVVDLFGGLTHDELERALVELAFKQGKDVDRDVFAATIEQAVAGYYLAEAEYEPPADETGADETDTDESDAETVLVAGPAAFPTVPENGPDLPHIMDVPARDIDREGLGESVAERLREEARTVAATGNADRARDLLDVSYDLEAWAPVEVQDARETLDRALE